jgi:cytochrome c biogenesis protein CcdA
MLRLIGVVASIGLADSMNPTTIAPALYLAAGERPRSSLTQFTLGVFAVYLVGGAILVFGPGELLLSLLPHPSHNTRYILELVAGVVVLIAAVGLWVKRRPLGRKELPTPNPEGKSSLLLGVTITAVELPTAFPYFAAVAAIVGSGLDPGRRAILLALYNVCFVLPLIAIVVTVAVAGDQATRVLGAAREFLQRRWPVLLAGVGLLAGVFVTLLGATGLAARGHGTAARVARRVRHLIPH